MSNVMFGWPIYSDVGPLYTPTLNGGGWGPVGVSDQFALTNLQDSRLARPARSRSAAMADTRFRVDLKADRQVGLLALPLHNLSSAAKVRFLGVPSTMLFDYEAGDDIAANGGTFTRAPTATVRAATYVDSLGVVQYAGENRCLRSEDFSTTWSATTTTVTTNTVTAPDGATTADTLTASAGNGTVKQAVTTTAVSWTFSVWLKRKTGTGNVDITMDGTTWVTKTLTTTAWTRFSVTQTGVAGTSNPGIRIVTNADAVYAWGAQVEIGSTATPYLPTAAAMVGAPRDSHFPTIDGARSLLLEGARTNLCLQSSDLGTTWAAVGTPTRSAAAHTAAGVTLDLIGDDDGAALEGYTQTVTFTGDAVKTVALFVKAGTSTSTMIRLRDTSASADRLLAAITWSGGLPVITMTTGTSRGYQTLAGSVFRILLATTSVTAANTNSLQIYPASDAALATASTGNVYVGGVQAENATFPSSYIPTTTTTVARGAETLSFSYTAVPQALTVDVKVVGGSPTNFPSDEFLWAIGTAAGTRLTLQKTGGAATLLAYHSSAAGTVSSAPAITTIMGDTIEARTNLASTGAITQADSVNGAAETVAAASASNALDAAWAATTIYLNADASAGNIGFNAFQYLRIMAGVQTLATIQAVVYDTGWVSSWPTAATVEDLDGINVGYFAFPASTITAFRYLSCQVDDTANTDGYVEIARLAACAAYTPTYNMVGGAKLELEDMTSREDMDGDSSIFNAKRVRRVLDFGLEEITESEAFSSAFRVQRRLGKSGQLVIVYNPADAVTLLYERAFLATMDKLSGLAALHYPRYAAAYRCREVL